jgi:hypothetical protein
MGVFRLFFSLMFLACFSFAQEYNSAVISVYVLKNLNENSGKVYPKLEELSNDPEFDLTFLADSLEKFLFSGFWDSFPFHVIERESVIQETHYHEYQSHYFSRENNESVSVATGYKMFVLEQTDYKDHDVDELMSIFPFLNSLITISLKFHIVHSNMDEKIIEIKPEFKIHFWDYKKEDTHTIQKSVLYLSSLHNWDPITQHPNPQILLLELHRAFNLLLETLEEGKDKLIHKVEKRLVGR